MKSLNTFTLYLCSVLLTIIIMITFTKFTNGMTVKDAYSYGTSSIEQPTVCLENIGCIEGIEMKGIHYGNNFDAFLGIPYAKPPIGSLRLANPVEITKWSSETLKATAAKSDCTQKNYLLPTQIVSGVEDCLYLNIYRPTISSSLFKSVNTDELLPVMVYIYGGGFFSGSANPLIHGPEYFMNTGDVILVTVSYRLGALGFLSTGDDTMPGNFGLKDQTVALKWIHQNIKAFGGNSLSVTLFGQSAGAVSVHMHMFSPLSEGLFHRAIVMSGNAAAPYNDIIRDPLKQAKKQAKLCGVPNADQLSNEELLNALRQVDVNKFVSAGDGFKYWHVDPLTTFRPVVEHNKTHGFLIGYPEDFIINGNYHQVPWMTGFVPFEGAVRALSITTNQTLLNSFNENFDFLLEKLMEMHHINSNNSKHKIDSIVNKYLNGSHKLTSENVQKFGDIISDRAFLHPLYKTIKNYVKYADLEKNPVYLYKFAYKGPYSYSFLYTGNTNNYGVVHCDDLIYLFRSPLIFHVDFTANSTDANVIRSLVETFVTFAKTGKPKIWAPFRQCNKNSLNSENAICDYQEFKNDKNSNNFIINVNNFYDTQKIRFWDELLHY